MTTSQEIAEKREAARVRREAIQAAGRARSKAAYTYMTIQERKAVADVIRGAMGEEMGNRVFDQLTHWERHHAAAVELERQQRNPKTAAEKLDEVRAYLLELEEDYRDLQAETRDY